MKVLQISNYMYPNIGGIEQVARDFANALTNAHIDQKIICFNETAKDGDYICKRNETVHDIVDGVEVIRCGCFTKVASQSLSFSYFSELKKVLKDFAPDVVVFHYPNPFVTSFLLPLLNKNTKLVVYWHLDITKQKFLGKLVHPQNLALIKRADKIVGATPKHINESAYTKYFGNKKEILPYAIDEKRLVISDKEKEKAEQIRKKYNGKLLCFSIGRHVPYKGIKYLVEASKYCDENIHFFIAGKGELTEQLKEQAKGDNKIEFLGRIDDSTWRSYLYACDVFCFPSITRNEGFGLALAEGMYYGKPAVTFTIPGSGVNYVNLDGVTGIECPNGDSKAYAEAIKKLGNSDELRKKYGKQARERIQDNFLFYAFAENVCSLLKEFV